MSILGISATHMKLRGHPLLSHHGVKSWPPTWLSLEEGGSQTLKGEIGILREVRVSRMMGFNRCFLVIDHHGSTYMGDPVRGQSCVLRPGSAVAAQSLWPIATRDWKPGPQLHAVDFIALW